MLSHCTSLTLFSLYKSSFKLSFLKSSNQKLFLVILKILKTFKVESLYKPYNYFQKCLPGLAFKLSFLKSSLIMLKSVATTMGVLHM